MSNFLSYTGWFFILYGIAGFTVPILSVLYSTPVISQRLIVFTEVMNVLFGACMLVVVLCSLREANEEIGKYFTGETAEWLWYGPMWIACGLIFFRKFRRSAFSMLLVCCILFVGYCFFMASFKLEPGV